MFDRPDLFLGRFVASAVVGAIALIVVAAVQVARSHRPDSDLQVREAAAPPMKFGGRLWTESNQQVKDFGDVRPAFLGLFEYVEFVTSDPSYRCLFLSEKPGTPNTSYKSVLVMQRIINGKWLRDGLESQVFDDNSEDLTEYRNGEQHGVSKHTYPNGQTHAIHHYQNGKLDGISEGWYQDGKPQWKSVYANGKEIRGEFWDENGKALGFSKK